MRAFASLVGLLVLASVAQAQPTFSVNDIEEVVQDFDAAEKGKVTTDVVVLSEGYQERADFMKKARALAKQLRDDQTSAPIRDVTTFDFYFVWVPSTDAGAPWRNGEKPRATPFGAHVEKDGSLATNDGAVDRATKKVLAGTKHDAVTVILIHLLSKKADHAADAPKGIPDANTGPDDVRDIADTPEDVFINLAKRDTCEKGGHGIGRVRQVDLDMRAFLHEFGHARFGLDDEYANDPDEAIPTKAKAEVALYPNTTIDPTGSRWKKRVPELFDANGKIKTIVEGGSGYGKNVWHAERLCRMNQSRNQGFCRVCVAAMRASLVDHGPFPAPAWVAPADGSKPSVIVDGKQRLVALSWKPATSEDPVSWHVELVGTDGKIVWKTNVEGSHDATEMPAPAPGVYTLRLSGHRLAKANPDNTSPVVETRFRMLAQPTEIVRKGITEALGDSER